MIDSVTFNPSSPVDAFSALLAEHQAEKAHVVLVAEECDDNQFDIKAEIEYQLDDLSAVANDWNENAYTSANQQLYAILFRVHGLYKTLSTYEPDSTKLRAAIKDIAKKKIDKKFKATTSCIYMLVSCVFASVPAKRSSTYALALQSIVDQYDNDVTEGEFIELVEDAGGIYELAKPVENKDGVKGDDQSPAANTGADDKVEGELLCFKNKQLSELLKEPNTAYVVVMMKNDKGQLSVYAVRDFEHGDSDVAIPALPQI